MLVKQLSAMEADYSERLADAEHRSRTSAERVCPDAHEDLRRRYEDSEAKHRETERDLAYHRQCADNDMALTRAAHWEKQQALEAQVHSLTGKASARGFVEQSEDFSKLKAERDALQNQVQLQARAFDRELQGVREKLGQCEDAMSSSRQAAGDSANHQLISTLSEENTGLKSQLAATWSQINEQTKKIDEERSIFWEELETVRRQKAGNAPTPPVEHPGDIGNQMAQPFNRLALNVQRAGSGGAAAQVPQVVPGTGFQSIDDDKAARGISRHPGEFLLPSTAGSGAHPVGSARGNVVQPINSISTLSTAPAANSVFGRNLPYNRLAPQGQRLQQSVPTSPQTPNISRAGVGGSPASLGVPVNNTLWR